jgi:DNA-binding response OmpR family regulator
MIPIVSPSPLSPSPSQPALPELLIVDSGEDAVNAASMLRGSYRVATTSAIDVAKQFLHRSPPALVAVELNLTTGDGVEICREAKALPFAPSVLVTTALVERVPDALAAGCDGVLLKPFAPNLLFARIGRLLRARSEAVRTRGRHQQLKAQHLVERSELLLAGTNRVWPNTQCPYCDHGGVTSFEFASHRRAWYACLECRKVWIAKRQE